MIPGDESYSIRTIPNILEVRNSTYHGQGIFLLIYISFYFHFSIYYVILLRLLLVMIICKYIYK